MDGFTGQICADGFQYGEIVGHQIEPRQTVVEAKFFRLGQTSSVIGAWVDLTAP